MKRINNLKRPVFAIIGILFISIQLAYGQGCSDAGACVLVANRAVGTAYLNDSTGLKIFLGSSYAKGAHEVDIISPYIGVGYKFKSEWMVQGRLTANSAENNYASARGLSDLIVDVDYRALSWLNVSFGFKLPISRADERFKENRYSLPMVFQPGLGTTDVLAGVSVHRYGLSAALGIQLPVDQNRNSFRSVYEETSSYLNTNGLERKGDALGTISYTLGLVGGKINIVPAVRAIYHLGEDRFINTDGVYESYTGSEGFTVNGILNAGFALTRHIGVNLYGAVPFVVREVHPDGLNRKYVAGIDISIQL